VLISWRLDLRTVVIFTGKHDFNFKLCDTTECTVQDLLLRVRVTDQAFNQQLLLLWIQGRGLVAVNHHCGLRLKTESRIKPGHDRRATVTAVCRAIHYGLCRQRRVNEMGGALR